MTRIFIGLVAVIVALYGVLLLITPPSSESPQNEPSATTTPPVIPDVTVIADKLSIPWDIAFLPDATMLVTERTGAVLHINPSTGSKTSIPVAVGARGEGGLLGIVLHPSFEINHYLYLYMSVQSTQNQTSNRVVRYTYTNGVLAEDRVIISNIPGAIYHDGGRMEFGPDGKLYITAGDAYRGANAQDMKSLAGKILRLNDDGSIPADNPFGDAIWSSGHRNPQGLAWDSEGRLWDTEHGPTGEGGRCCHDEINRIEKGANYGWPTIIGDEKRDGMIEPAKHSGEDTWAPASLVYFNGALYFGGLAGEGLYEAKIESGTIASITKHLDGTYGRIRTIRVGPDNMFYITTSNTDGRGAAGENDDRIVRINPASLR